MSPRAALTCKAVALASVLVLTLAGCSGELSSSNRFLGFTPAGDFSAPVQSVEERKFATVIRQRYDFSCGSAALATLLHYHYNDPSTEAAVFRGMWDKGDRPQIRKLGFSLLDMKRYLDAQGLKADGFKVSLDQVAQAGVPGIALVTLKGYRHFVVVKGVANGEVLVGDPSTGLQTVPAASFVKSWNGIYFIINSNPERGRTSFNAPTQWAQYTRAPLGSRFSDPVSLQALALTAPFYRDF